MTSTEPDIMVWVKETGQNRYRKGSREGGGSEYSTASRGRRVVRSGHAEDEGLISDYRRQ